MRNLRRSLTVRRGGGGKATKTCPGHAELAEVVLLHEWRVALARQALGHRGGDDAPASVNDVGTGLGDGRVLQRRHHVVVATHRECIGGGVLVSDRRTTPQ